MNTFFDYSPLGCFAFAFGLFFAIFLHISYHIFKTIINKYKK